jgi:hypothetical protein
MTRLKLSLRGSPWSEVSTQLSCATRLSLSRAGHALCIEGIEVGTTLTIRQFGGRHEYP